MSRLTICDERRPAQAMLRTEDAARIGHELARIGVRFERWDSPVRLAPDAADAAILEAYRPHLDRLMGESGAGAADVITLDETTADRAALREKFLREHTHTEDEVRFFVRGEGSFVLHVEGRVYQACCTAGDLISVPSGIAHWFDAGERPSVTALRVFTDRSGWVAHYTGDDISARFPAAA